MSADDPSREPDRETRDHLTRLFHIDRMTAAIRQINRLAPTHLLLEQRADVLTNFDQYTPSHDEDPELLRRVKDETRAEILADIDAELQRRGCPIPGDPS